MTWHPLESVPDPLRLALSDAVRAFVLQRDIGLGIGLDADGLLVVPLPEGASVRVGLRASGQSTIRFGARAAIRIDLEGRAVAGRASYGLGGRAVVDIKTKAFLEIVCDILWQDGG